MSDNPDIEALKEYLPFYVNGTIQAEDKAAVEEGLALSPDLRAALDEERRLQSKFNRSMDAELAAVSTEAEAGQAQQLAAMTSASEQQASGLNGALRFLNPRNWSPAITYALVAAAVGQAAILAYQSGTIEEQSVQIAELEDENFKLAAGQNGGDEKARIILELRENVLWTDAAKLIDSESLSIVGGTGQGVLMLGFDGDEAELEKILERLKASELVLNASKAA